MSNEEKLLLVVVLMIKNESSSICDTLTSYTSGGLKHFFVLDTGSTDDTVLLTQAFFDENQLTGIIEQEPFVDFATSRNRALELAEDCFPHAAFFIMPDAEWHLQYPENLIQFCEQEQNTDTPLYLMPIKMNATEFTTARLFRVANRIRFKGVVHEVPEIIASIKAPDPIYFVVNSTYQGIEKSKRRWLQDLILLTKTVEENPDDPRSLFYLAQTYECLGELEQAYQFYLRRSAINGWDEENFITYFRLGYLAESLFKNNDTREASWATAMNHYLKAFSLRFHRIEPLVKIASHYWPDNIQACYLFIKQAYDTPYPKNDLLFIEKDMYLFERYEIMSRCAWYMGKYELGRQVTLRALEIHPETPHLQQNLALYQEKLSTDAVALL